MHYGCIAMTSGSPQYHFKYIEKLISGGLNCRNTIKPYNRLKSLFFLKKKRGGGDHAYRADLFMLQYPTSSYLHRVEGKPEPQWKCQGKGTAHFHTNNHAMLTKLTNRDPGNHSPLPPWVPFHTLPISLRPRFPSTTDYTNPMMPALANIKCEFQVAFYLFPLHKIKTGWKVTGSFLQDFHWITRSLSKWKVRIVWDVGQEEAASAIVTTTTKKVLLVPVSKYLISLAEASMGSVEFLLIQIVFNSRVMCIFISKALISVSRWVSMPGMWNPWYGIS